ncbi:MAG: YceI family protein [Candidatus Rokuibacteriota bacterium]
MPSRLRGAFLAAVLLGALPASSALAATERWVVESGQSRVAFDAFHALGNFTGTSETPTGEVELDIEDLKKPIKGSLTVPVASFRTGETGRDKDLRRALDGEHHPEIRYQIDKVDSSFPSLAENDVLLTIHGVLTMRGTARPVAFMGRIRLRQGTLWVRGESRTRPADFGIPPLRSWLISMKEHVLARFDLVLSKAK